MWQSSAALPIVSPFVWYWSLAATAFIVEEPALLIAGLAAHNGHINLFTAGIVATVSVWIPDIGLYYVGRSGGRWVRRTFPSARRALLRTYAVVRRHPWRASVAVRYAYALRIMLPISCGAARVPLSTYLIGSLIGSITWAYGILLFGWGFGESARLLLGHAKRYEKYMIAVILVVCLIVLLIMRKRHIEETSVEVLSAGDAIAPPPSGDKKAP